MFLRPSILLFLGMGIGIAMESHFSPPLWNWLLLMLSSILWSLWFHFRPSSTPFFLYGLLFLGMCSGALLFSWDQKKLIQENTPFSNDSSTVIHFRLAKKQKSNSYYHKWLVDVHGVQHQDSLLLPTSATLLLRIPTDQKIPMDFLHEYYALGKLSAIRGAQSPGAFDYAHYMKQHSVMYQFTIDSVLLRERFQNHSFKQTYLNLLRRIDSSELNPQAKETLKALTLADRTTMNPDTTQILSLAGIMHLFAISGLHIGLLFGFLLWVWNQILGSSQKTISILLSLALLTLYGFFIQFPTSVSRALIMLAFYYGFQLLHRPSLPLHSLAMAGIFILFLNPMQWFSIGFQLSFVAVFFIFWLYPSFKKLLLSWHRRLRDLVAVTLAAQLGTLPLSLLYFHQMSWVGIVLNILILPFAALLVILSFLCLILLCAFPEFTWNIQFYNGVTRALFFMVEKGADLNANGFTQVAFSWPEVFALWAILIYLKYVISYRSSLHWARLWALVALFLAIQLFIDWRALQKKEIVVYQNFKNTVISAKKGNSLGFWSTVPLDSQFHIYSVAPYWIKNRKPTLHFDSLSFQTLEIENVPIYLISQKLPKHTENQSLFILQSSPKIDWDSLFQLPSKYIVIDGSNYPNYVQELQEFQKSNYPSKILWSTHEKGAFQLPLN